LGDVSSSIKRLFTHADVETISQSIRSDHTYSSPSSWNEVYSELLRKRGLPFTALEIEEQDKRLGILLGLITKKVDAWLQEVWRGKRIVHWYAVLTPGSISDISRKPNHQSRHDSPLSCRPIYPHFAPACPSEACLRTIALFKLEKFNWSLMFMVPYRAARCHHRRHSSRAILSYTASWISKSR
jgi:hypothetical protein